MVVNTISNDKALDQLIKMSNMVGADTALVQGGGGNTSVKSDDGCNMFIKASGSALKNMNKEKGWRRMDIAAVLSVLADDSLASKNAAERESEVVARLLWACNDGLGAGARPSVEAHLHALLDKYVIHLHPVAVGAFVNAKQGKQRVEEIFAKEQYPPLWVPYVDPGLTLGKKIEELIAAYSKKYGRKPPVVFLDKHGLLVSDANCNTAVKIVTAVIDKLDKAMPKVQKGGSLKPSRDEITSAKLAVRKAFFAATGKYSPVVHFENANVAAILNEKDGAKLLAAGSLTPDELVYSNGPALYIEKTDADFIGKKLKTFIEKNQRPALAYAVKGIGLLVACEPKTASVINDIQSGSCFARMAAAQMGGIRVLTEKEAQFINNWESEAFRKQVAGAKSGGELTNRVAVVTGAGSGLGRSIALGLARAGAITIITDIDEAAASATEAMIKAEMPGAMAAAVKCNVTDEQSVENAFAAVMDKWGGVDIIVNAAGVAPAYSLVDLPVDKWRLSLEINLTGYFLMARAAARIMIKQGMGGSIINITSKSGLDASKNNTPYNATKSGEIHMARGWAMELGEHGIRVNCVAPGNVFEGSKIWNPDYIKACAKKYGIKPQEVIPYYVNKTHLKREIKGQDIADSVVFLCSDKARVITGQVIVADSGQVMVR